MMSENPVPYKNLSRIDYPQVEEDGRMPPLTRDAIRGEAKEALLAIREYITTDAFVAMLTELYELDPERRDEFVRTELLDPARLKARNIEPPPGVKVQRSQFGDDRPTVFCVTKLMSDRVRKVTYTFDSGMFAKAT